MTTWNFTLPFSDEDVAEYEAYLDEEYPDDPRDDLGYEVYGDN